MDQERRIDNEYMSRKLEMSATEEERVRRKKGKDAEEPSIVRI